MYALEQKQLEKYSKKICAFGLAQLKYGVWIKAGLQPFFLAETLKILIRKKIFNVLQSGH